MSACQGPYLQREHTVLTAPAWWVEYLGAGKRSLSAYLPGHMLVTRMVSAVLPSRPQMAAGLSGLAWVSPGCIMQSLEGLLVSHTDSLDSGGTSLTARRSRVDIVQTLMRFSHDLWAPGGILPGASADEDPQTPPSVRRRRVIVSSTA